MAAILELSLLGSNHAIHILQLQHGLLQVWCRQSQTCGSLTSAFTWQPKKVVSFARPWSKKATFSQQNKLYSEMLAKRIWLIQLLQTLQHKRSEGMTLCSIMLTSLSQACSMEIEPLCATCLNLCKDKITPQSSMQWFNTEMRSECNQLTMIQVFWQTPQLMSTLQDVNGPTNTARSMASSKRQVSCIPCAQNFLTTLTGPRCAIECLAVWKVIKRQELSQLGPTKVAGTIKARTSSSLTVVRILGKL